MVQMLVADELARSDAAFAGNRLLSTFSSDARGLVEPFATVIDLEPGDLLFDRGEHIASSIFPFGTTMVSLVVDLDPGRSIEVASIGREGAVGGIISCGNVPAFSRARVNVPGPALQVEMGAIEDAKRRSQFVAHIFCRYSDYLLAQVMQSVPCNAFHPITARTARWLLTAQDRAGDRIELTQEALAALLGVQRTTINAVIGQFQDEGLISSARGVVRVTDRAGIKARACQCYDALEHHFTQVIGASGVGGNADCA
jgi:CRP-like cAMP-binding protein